MLHVPASRRRRLVSLLLALVAAAATSPGPAAAGDTVPSPLERVRALTRVDGSAVGEGGDEGRFFTLAKELLAKPGTVSPKDLLADANPVARAMGLYLLVRTKGKEALPDLRARLSDRARFSHFPGGCCGWTTSVGGFARLLARNRRHLGGETAEPLVDAEALLGIDLAVLAEDRAAYLHDEVRLDLTRGAETRPLSLRLVDLRRVGAGLTDLQIVKAVGRLTPSDANRAFLVARLDDSTLAGEARLAAASGLTRSTHAEAVAAIGRARAFLDGAAGKPVTDRLLATIEARKAHEERWKPIHAVRTWMEHEEMRPQIAVALKVDRPLAIPELDEAFGLAVVTGDLREVLVASVSRVAAGLGTTASSWDTDSDAAYLLEALAVPTWKDEHDDRGLKAEERTALLATLRPYLLP